MNVKSIFEEFYRESWYNAKCRWHCVIILCGESEAKITSITRDSRGGHTSRSLHTPCETWPFTHTFAHAGVSPIPTHAYVTGHVCDFVSNECLFQNVMLKITLFKSSRYIFKYIISIFPISLCIIYTFINLDLGDHIYKIYVK